MGNIINNVAENLSAWMEADERLRTIKDVASASKVGFGTVRRVKNGDGNPTITSLYDIARAFGRPVEDLLGAPHGTSSKIVHFGTAQPQAAYNVPRQELLDLFDAMSDEGRQQLIGMAKVLAATHVVKKTKAKNNAK